MVSLRPVGVLLRDGPGVQQCVFEIREVVLVEGELSYEGAIRDATEALEHRDGLRQNFLESHKGSPRVGGLSKLLDGWAILPKHLTGRHLFQASHVAWGLRTSLRGVYTMPYAVDYFVALYAMLFWTVSCSAASPS